MITRTFQMLALLLTLLVTVHLSAQTSPPAGQGLVFLVRHAERADAGGPSQSDPELSEIGRARAQSLAATLDDAGISAIYVTEYKRTKDTAAPLAKALGVAAAVVSANDQAGLLERLGSGSGNALVVGHSNTLPKIMQALGVSPPAIADDEYDNLFIVIPSSAGKPRLVQLHFR